MSDAVGYLAAVVAILFFGSNFAPVKKYETGDGIFFQWVMCTGIWIVGLVVNLIQGQPKFEPVAMLGGFLWCTGNIFTVPIIKTIGLGLGLLIWGLTNLILGWASGNFGLFGLDAKPANDTTLNYIGVVIAVCSIALYAGVKTDLDTSPNAEAVRHRLLDEEIEKEGKSWVDSLSDLQKQVVGVVMAALAGVFYGVNFDPPQYVMDNDANASQEGIDYVFAHFCGIYLTSTAYMMIYCAVSKNKPKIYPEVLLPAIISGMMWGIADSAWFVANSKLQFVVSFPIVTTGPGIIGAIWGVFVFKEIKGRRNFLFLGSAFCMTAVGIALIVLSKT